MQEGQNVALVEQLKQLPPERVAEVLSSQLNAMTPEQLLEGVKGTIITTLLSALLNQLKTWMQDPARQQQIVDFLINMITKVFTK